MQTEYALANLIKDRRRALDLDAHALGVRLGYHNPAKAAGRVQALCDGHITNRKSMAAIRRLAAALEIPQIRVDQAVAATAATIAEQRAQDLERVRLAAEADEKNWRRNFRPHAVIETANKCPSQIVMCGMTGGIARWLIVPLNTARPPLTFVRQVLDVLPDRLWTGLASEKIVPFFGRAHGFIINYGADRAIRFTLGGQAIQILLAAYRPGKINLF